MSVDMGSFIAPKSDQLNADDLIAGPRTITVTGVRASGKGDDQQPISINFEGDNGKPYKPCKSMRRVMVFVWGANSAAYVGRSMTLYRDESVQFGADKVGGIRISHMSHIDAPQSHALTATRGRRAPYTVQPMPRAASATAPSAAATPPYPTVADYEACTDVEALKTLKARSRETWKQTPADEAPLIQAASKRATTRLAPKSTETEKASLQLDGTEATAIAALESAFQNGRQAVAEAWAAITTDYAARKQDVPLAVEAKHSDINESLKE
jgi:hypothetical protein